MTEAAPRADARTPPKSYPMCLAEPAFWSLHNAVQGLRTIALLSEPVAAGQSLPVNAADFAPLLTTIADRMETALNDRTENWGVTA